MGTEKTADLGRGHKNVPTQDPGHRKPDDAIREFFDQWDLYRIIIQRDYMAHRGIHAAMRRSLSRRKKPFSIVDLGCGDGSVIGSTLDGLSVREYVGVDLSSVALREIERKFGDRPFNLHLVKASFSDYLASSGSDPVDVIIAGFAAHHLPDEQKPGFFSDCRRMLRPGGELYLYDVFRNDGQSRDEYLTWYCRPIEQDWTALTVEERHSIVEHIQAYDFPISFETMAEIAGDAGFDVPPTADFADAMGVHRLYRFTIAPTV